MSDRRAPVVVVGLGPVGATAALLLARAGVPVVAIDRDAEVYPHPRAVALDDDALRVLQRAGVRDGDGLDLLAGGTVRIRGRDGRPLVALGPPPTTTGHPGLAFFRQPQLEASLRERLRAEPLVDLRLGTTVEGLVTAGGAGDDAVLRIAGPVHASDLRASWVLACDGGRSTLRAAIGSRLRGGTSASRWLVIDTDAPEGGGDRAAHDTGRPDRGAADDPARPPAGPAPEAADFEFVADPRGPWVHGPLAGGAHRWEVLLDGRAEDERARLEDPEAARALLARRVGAPVPPVRRAAVYAFHARVADRWRVGRVLLLGDAAHLAPPFAGQGLCAGLRDAGAASWRVAEAWHGRAADRLLDAYVAERRLHVLRTTALAVALGVVVEARRPRLAAVRDAVLARAASAGPVRRWIARGGWRPPSTVRRGTVATDRALRHRAGEVLPQPVVAGSLLDDVLPAGWVLLGADVPGPLAGLAGATAVPFPGVDDDGALRRWVAPATVALVRPDRVVFGTASSAGVEALVRHAATASGAGVPGPEPR